MEHQKPRILLYDIETTHNIVATFRLSSDDYIPYENILQERYIVCAAWKWLDDPKVYTTSVLDDPARFKKNPHDDYHVVKTLYETLERADVIVAHNGDQYDAKFIAGRGVFHKLKPLPPINSVDTYKIAKLKFLFNSNRLDYLGQYLGVGKKVNTGKGLWLRVLKGDAEAVRKMVKYNKGDVTLLEKIFKILRPYIPSHLSWVFTPDQTDMTCPRCGSRHTKSKGVHRAITRSYQRRVCLKCGGYFRNNVTVHRTKTRAI